MFSKFAKRIVSGLSAAVLAVSNTLPLIPINAFAEDAVPAHNVNVFDIDIKQGANYYSDYDVSETQSGSEGSVSSLTDAYVWQADSSDEGHKFIYNVKLSLSGIGAGDIAEDPLAEDALGTGFIKISVPRHILKFKDGVVTIDGEYADELEMPVTSWDMIYSKDDGETDPLKKKYYKETSDGRIYDPHIFVYYIDDKDTPDNESDDVYVIFNTQPISAGEVYEFPIAYITTKNTWEYKDLEASNPCQASLEVRSWQKEPDVDYSEGMPLSAKTSEIPVYIDTTAEIRSTSKKIDMTSDGKALLTKSELSDAALAAVSGDADDAYMYAVWAVSTEIATVTQKYDLTIHDVYSSELDLVGTDKKGFEHKAKGEIVAVKMGSSYVPFDADGNATLSGLTASGRRTDYVLVKYNRKSMDGYDGVDAMDAVDVNPAPALYQTKNNVTVTVTPADGQDKASDKTDSAVYKYEKKKPEFHPVEDTYDVHEYGLYAGGQKRVGNKNNVTSYELEKLANGELIDGIKYETVTYAYSYGKTIADLNNTLSTMDVTETEEGFEIVAADRIYTFLKNSNIYTIRIGDGAPVEYTVSGSYFADGVISEDDAQRIAGLDLSENYYGQKSLIYTLDNRSFTLIPNVLAPTQNTVALESGDYSIDSIDYEYAFRNYSYNEEDMEFVEGEKNEDPLGGDNDILEFYAYVDGGSVPQLVGRYNVVNRTVSDIDSTIVDSLSGSSIVFKSGSNVTGYQIITQNKYFYVELVTKPSLTIYSTPGSDIQKAAEKLMDQTDPSTMTEKKIGIENNSTFGITNEDAQSVRTFNIKGTDYIADIVKRSSISKNALGERTSYRGQDGNVYKSENDTLLSQYRLAWLITMSEVADGIENSDGTVSNNVPVSQQSGVFYDLLPEHCDVLIDSINVYKEKGKSINASTESLPASSFTVSEKRNFNNSGRKLLVIEINEPCAKNYTVTYCTIHSHDDIQDYGSTALNTVAYQTGNPDIGDGYPDDGGNYAVTLSKYMKNLDPDNGDAKRFIYAEATEDILALFPTSSGIYKKVSTDSSPTFAKSATVYNGEGYTYSIRMQNDSSTKATDIAILDSVENYRTHGGVQYNKGISKDRDWSGTIESFELKGLADKVRNSLISTLADEIVRSYTENFGLSGTNERIRSDAADIAEKIVDGTYEYAAGFDADVKAKTEAYRFSDVLHVIVYSGSDIVDLENENYSDSNSRQYLLKRILGKIPEDSSETELNAIARQWNSVPFDFTSGIPTDGTDLADVSAFVIFIDEPFVLDKGDSVSFKVNMRAPDTIDNVSKKHYGDELEAGGTQPILPHPATYNNVYRSFRSSNDRNAAGEYTYFYTHYDYTQVNYSTVGDVSFAKVDAKHPDEKIAGVKFSLSGISDYGKSYNETLESDVNGVVTFKNLERGRYTLIETDSDEDHLLDVRARTVEVDFYGAFMFVSVDSDEHLIKTEMLDRNGDPVYADEEKTIKLYNYSLKNEPRYHGTFDFRKVNNVTGEAAEGAVFTLEGTSDFGTSYNMTETSDSDGTVSFGDIEIGTYTLTEITPPDGYMPIPTGFKTYTVKSSGTDRVTFTVTANNSSNTNVGKDTAGKTTIGNSPLAEIKLLKADSVSTDPLDGAVFTLTAVDTASLIEADESFYTALGWTKTGSDWQLTSSEIGPQGQLSLAGIPVSTGASTTYTLTETTAPVGYTATNSPYTVTITKNAAGSERAYTISITNGQGVNLNTSGRYEPASDSEAEFIRISNDPVFESAKDLIKSWVGGTPASGSFFPVLNLSSDQPEYNVKIVTINNNLRDSVLKDHRSAFLGLNKVDKNEYESHKSDFTPCFDNPNEWGENGSIYMRYNSTTNMVDYYTDSVIVYMPKSCAGLFQNCTSAVSIDLSEFDFSKVTDMSNMFSGCSNLTSVTFPNDVDTSKVTTMSGMFSSCEKLTTPNVGGFNTSNVTDMSSMFKNCKAITTLDIRNFNTSNVTTFKSMFDTMSAVTNIQLDYTKFTAGDKLTTVENMFNECNNLAGIDLRGFGNCTNLESIKNWFYNCNMMKYVDLSNFSTSEEKLKNIVGVFYKIGLNVKSPNGKTDPGTNCGTKVFAKCAWEFADNSTFAYSAVDWMRVNLYGKMYKNKAEDGKPGNPTFDVDCAKEHFKPEYRNPPLTTGSGSNLRTTGGYFNPAYIEGTTEYTSNNYSEYYKAFCNATYGTAYTTTALFSSVPQTIRRLEAAAPEFPDIPSIFEQQGDINEEDAEGKADGIRYTFEYQTAGNVPIPAGTQDVEVAETVKLIVKLTQNEKTYTKTYIYKGSVKATWKKNASDEWVCEFNVLDTDALMYAWENSYEGYTCDATIDTPITTKNPSPGVQDENAVIKNISTATPTPMGSLSVTKNVDELKENADPDDEFEFTVTMLNSDDSAYTSRPFNSEGKYVFKLRNGETKLITNIPAGCRYTVAETMSGLSVLDGKYSYFSSECKYVDSENVVTDDTAQTIAENKLSKVTITNKIERIDLLLEKSAELKKYIFTDPDDPVSLDADDSDAAAWKSREFRFDIRFDGLIPGETYTYELGGYSYSFTGETAVITGVKLSDGKSVVFHGLPVTAKYIITENETFSDTVEDEYKDIYTVKVNDVGSEDQTTGETVLSDATDEVTFTNLREITKPDYIKLAVNKEWYSNGSRVYWLNGTEGKPAKFRRYKSTEIDISSYSNYYTDGEDILVEDPDNGVYIPYTGSESNRTYLDQLVSFPSFLNIYLGYGLYDPDLNTDGRHQLLMQGTDTRQTLNVKNDWSYTFEDLPKQGSLVTYDASGNKVIKYLNYVYYVTEIMPTGFELKKGGDQLDPDLEADQNPYYTESPYSFYDSSSYTRNGNGIITSIANSQSVTLKNQSIPTYKLSVGKLANGNFASRDRDFDFIINFVDSEGKPLKNLVMTVEDLEGNIINPTRTITLDSNGDYSAALPHNTRLIFRNVPQGTTYTITDRETGGYDIWSNSFDFGADVLPDLSGGTMPSGFAAQKTRTGTIESDDVGYLYINTLQGEVPTGIDLNTGIPVITVITIGGWLFCLRKKRRDAACGESDENA